MSLEQTLKKVQNLIHETLPNLELFVDENVQPSSDDCDKLQMQIFRLQEQLSVFKHLKASREVSPSFGIHAKISESVIANTEPLTDSKQVEEENKTSVTESIPQNTNNTSPETNTLKKENFSAKKIEITLNQKFQFINDLFGQNAKEYELALDQLNNCASSEDAEIYLNSLKTIYSWKDNNENYKRLKELTKNRFA